MVKPQDFLKFFFPQGNKKKESQLGSKGKAQTAFCKISDGNNQTLYMRGTCHVRTG